MGHAFFKEVFSGSKILLNWRSKFPTKTFFRLDESFATRSLTFWVMQAGFWDFLPEFLFFLYLKFFIFSLWELCQTFWVQKRMRSSSSFLLNQQNKFRNYFPSKISSNIIFPAKWIQKLFSLQKQIQNDFSPSLCDFIFASIPVTTQQNNLPSWNNVKLSENIQLIPS